MPSPPLTTREFAYLAVIGDGTHQEVTDILGLEPSLAWNAGERSEHTGRIQKRMLWQKKSALDDKEELSKHIESLLFILGRKHKEVQDLFFRGYDPYIQCVGYYPESGHGTHLSREIIRQAGQLHLGIDLDFYQISSNGHDG
jgi:Domain of unknown function (DUF4279)